MDSFFGIGISELFMIAVVALIVLGPERLPNALREVAKFIKTVRQMINELTSQFGDEFKALEDLNPQKILRDLTDDPDKAADAVAKTLNGTPTPAKPAATTAAKPAATTPKSTTTPAATATKSTTTATPAAASSTAPASTTSTAEKPVTPKSETIASQSTTTPATVTTTAAATGTVAEDATAVTASPADGVVESQDVPAQGAENTTIETPASESLAENVVEPSIMPPAMREQVVAAQSLDQAAIVPEALVPEALPSDSQAAETLVTKVEAETLPEVFPEAIASDVDAPILSEEQIETANIVPIDSDVESVSEEDGDAGSAEKPSGEVAALPARTYTTSTSVNGAHVNGNSKENEV